MGKKFKGSFEALKIVVDATGASGEWRDQDNHHQFRANDGAILNWWESSGTIQFQGPPEEKQSFEQIFDLALQKYG